jgi:hypothetical protein
MVRTWRDGGEQNEQILQRNTWIEETEEINRIKRGLASGLESRTVV